jgi:hypothetical protein
MQHHKRKSSPQSSHAGADSSVCAVAAREGVLSRSVGSAFEATVFKSDFMRKAAAAAASTDFAAGFVTASAAVIGETVLHGSNGSRATQSLAAAVPANSDATTILISEEPLALAGPQTGTLDYTSSAPFNDFDDIAPTCHTPRGDPNRHSRLNNDSLTTPPHPPLQRPTTNPSCSTMHRLRCALPARIH